MRPLLALLFLTAFAVVAAGGGGCTRYEHDLVEPADVAQHIGTKAPVVVSMDPAVRYEARTASDRLVLFIVNEADAPLKLLGEDSYAVDPRGESHPLPTRTIAPGTSTKLVFPPVPPTFRQSGPSFGVGVGVGVGSAHYRRGYYGGYYGRYYGDPFYDDFPRYYQLADDGTTYWDWPGNGTEISVRLVYQRGEQRFEHEFRFRRVKM